MLLTLLSLLIGSAHAQELSELRELSRFDKKHSIFSDKERIKVRTHPNKYGPVFQRVGLEEILTSPEELGVIKAGTFIYTMENSRKVFVDQDINVRFHRMPDEQGFKYLISKNGDIKFKVETKYIHSIAPETVMYEPPHSYTPAPEREFIRWDQKLNAKYQLGVASSYMKADYLQDLLNLGSSPSGQMNHISGSVIADWEWPIKVGLGAHYQRAQFNTDGGTTNFSTFSFGPIFKSKTFYPNEVAVRLNAQISYSPLGKMDVNISRGSTGFKFNSTDLHLGVEFPFPNRWGEFNVELFIHQQWINLKDQEEIVSLESSNKPNQAIGLGLSQVF